MNKKIESFIRDNNLKHVIFKYNDELFNETNEYPETYYMYENGMSTNYLYQVERDKKRLIYKSVENSTFILFLIKVLFVKYSKTTEVNTEIYEEESRNITSKAREIYYKGYLYVTLKDESQIEAGKIRLNRRACHLTMFIDALFEAKIINEKINNNKLFELMAKYK